MTTKHGLFAEVKPRRLEGRTLWLWALANSVAGLGIGAAILLFADSTASTSSLVPMSIVFANVVGFVAVLTVRYVIPRYSGLPAWVRYPLGVLTLIGGGVFGSAVTILVNPLIVFYQMRLALMVVSFLAPVPPGPRALAGTSMAFFLAAAWLASRVDRNA